MSDRRLGDPQGERAVELGDVRAVVELEERELLGGELPSREPLDPRGLRIPSPKRSRPLPAKLDEGHACASRREPGNLPKRNGTGSVNGRCPSMSCDSNSAE